MELLIFDLDDTLINHGHASTGAWVESSKDMVNKYHVDIDPVVLGELIGQISHDIWFDENKRPRGNYDPYELRKGMIVQAFEQLNIDNNEVIDYMVNQYAYYKIKLVDLYDDSLSTLVELRKQGYKIALLTNGDSSFQRKKIERFQLEPYFDGIFISGEMGIDKPHREAFELVCQSFNVRLEDACMIGDNYLWEVKAPKDYGMMSVWVNRVHDERADNVADYTIENISSLIEIFKNIKYMKKAYEQAKKALLYDEVPIGAVIVKDDEIIAQAHNLKETEQLVYKHAEMIVIEEAEKKLGLWHLDDCILYSTLEPCLMCSGAIIQSRIKKVVFGAYEKRWACLTSVIEKENINHYPDVIGGVYKEQCSSLISSYFKNKRKG